MKSLMNMLVKGFAGVLFVALLAVNVQGGTSGSNFLDSSTFNVQTAKAGNCPVGSDPCAFYSFPDGTQIGELGEVIVVTPDKNLK